jgi:hypothetical protein
VIVASAYPLKTSNGNQSSLFMPEWRVFDGDAVKRKGSSKDDPANLVDMSCSVKCGEIIVWRLWRSDDCLLFDKCGPCLLPVLLESQA